MGLRGFRARWGAERFRRTSRNDQRGGPSRSTTPSAGPGFDGRCHSRQGGRGHQARPEEVRRGNQAPWFRFCFLGTHALERSRDQIVVCGAGGLPFPRLSLQASVEPNPRANDRRELNRLESPRRHEDEGWFCLTAVCTENLIRVDDALETPKLTE
jgi:hypothetical protein